MTAEHDAHGRVDGGAGRALGHFEVNDFFLQPVAEVRDAVCEVAAGFVLGIDDDLDVEARKEGGEARAEVLGEGVLVAKGFLTPLLVLDAIVK